MKIGVNRLGVGHLVVLNGRVNALILDIMVKDHGI